MKYIIMAGGDYRQWETPRQLLKVNGEEIIARTIRLLKENGVEDIAISSNNPVFDRFGVSVLHHDNSFVFFGGKQMKGCWTDAFYPMDKPTCYLFGDVVFSPEAIRKIIKTETNDVELFASAPPFSEMYKKPWPEPFAFKVVNTDHFKQAIKDCKKYAKLGFFWREPIAWELWTVIRDGKLTTIPDVYKLNYTIINDYTCDVDGKGDLEEIEKYVK